MIKDCCFVLLRLGRILAKGRDKWFLFYIALCETQLPYVKIGHYSFLIQFLVPFCNTGLFISPSGTSELDCATTKTDTAERSISIGRESLKVFFVLGALAYLKVPPLGGSRDEKWHAQ